MIGWNSIPKYQFRLRGNKSRGMNYWRKIGKRLVADLFEILFFRGKTDEHSCGDVPKVGYFFDIPDEFKIKSLYSNDLILNIASKSKEAVQKLKFLDSPVPNTKEE